MRLQAAGLTGLGRADIERGMTQSILVFDFGTNEEAAQQARHKIEGWKQAFRLGDKMKLKFERKESSEKNTEDAAESEDSGAAAKPATKAKADAKKTAAKSAARASKEGAKAEETGNVRLFIRLAFSDHEKLSYQRWFDRIPGEEPFKSAKGETVRAGDTEFAKTAETFDALD
jgi:hypothetical protein